MRRAYFWQGKEQDDTYNALIPLVDFYILNDLGVGIFGWPETNICNCLTLAQGQDRGQ